MNASKQQLIDMAQRLDSLAEANESSPRDYYGSQFWSDEDVQLIKQVAQVLRDQVRGTDQPGEQR